MFVDDIKKRVTQAMKDQDAVARDILRLALGEIQTAEARSNKSLTDDEALAAVKKLVKSNEETLAQTADAAQKATLEKEIAVLTSLLPATLGVDQIVLALAGVADAVKAAKSDGQATGVAMKELKAQGANVKGNDVGAAVKAIRG